MTDKTKLLTALFKDRDSVEKGYQSALNQGYNPEDINFVMSDETRNKYFDGKDIKLELGDKSAQGLGVGGAIGGALGGIAAAIVAIGTAVVIPGLGIVVSGPLAAGLLGVGAGGLAGGLLGTLIGMGIPEERVKLYEEGINSGGILMGVTSRSDIDSAKITKEWENYHLDKIHS